MLEYIRLHSDRILFLIGLVLLGGTIGGKGFQRFKIPQVVGFIFIGISLGNMGLGLIDNSTIHSFNPFNYIALGIIGFMIGGELKKEVLYKYGKQFMIILFSEGIVSFIVVSLLVGTVGMFLYDDIKMIWGIALLLGAISSATAPAATSSVLWEYKTRGPLTRTIMGIVALDDALALILFAIASTIANVLLGNNGNMSMMQTFTQPIYEMGGAVILGIMFGFILKFALIYFIKEDRMLVFSVGSIILTVGMAVILKLDVILSAMVLGATFVNIDSRRSKEIFKMIERFTPPIYVIFFVLVGAKINFTSMTWVVIVIGLLYLLGRSGGKMLGAFLGGKFSGAPATVRKYLPYCLFAQAGVAIGLSILAGERFPGEVGNEIVIIITAATFIVEIAGPPLVRYGVTKAGEIGLNITEDDLIKMSLARDAMDSEVITIPEQTLLPQILEIFSENDNLYYPVVDKNKKLKGVVTIDNIKDTFMAQELSEFLIAVDLMEPVDVTVKAETPMPDVKEIMTKNRVDYVPVLDDDRKVLGLLESRNIERHITKKMLELEQTVNNLECCEA